MSASSVGTRNWTTGSYYLEFTVHDPNDPIMWETIVGLSGEIHDRPGNWAGGTSASIGLVSDGAVWTDNARVGTVTPFTLGCIVSVAVSGGNVWFRVNGGNWNGSGVANPLPIQEGFQHRLVRASMPLLLQVLVGQHRSQ
jgi:hypothetical protein